MISNAWCAGHPEALGVCVGPVVLVLAGPTAAGKTAAALAVAEAYGGIIVSADAMQVYRGFDVGTAKPSAEEQARVPHRGLDLVEAHEAFDAADFVRVADAAIAEGRPVIVAGGTSLYVRALLRGLVPTPEVDPALRAEMEALPDPHAALALVDPALAARLHPNDHVRIVRGLEVFRATGERLSDLQARHATEADRVRAVGLWLDRDDLRERIGRRLGEMFDRGYVAEVRGLLDQGVSRDAKPMRSLGYLHVAAHLLDGLPLDDAKRLTERDTWELARKQRNWMRQLGFPRVAGDDLDAALAAAREAFGPP